jgi:hypothetical protein
MSFHLSSVSTENRTEATETEFVGFIFLLHRSVFDSQKTEILKHRKTEPNNQFKPNAHP